MNTLIRIFSVLVLWLLVSLAHAGTRHYYYTDPQGTPLAKADASGTIIATYDYAPYGVAVASMSPAPNGPGYTGHVNDPDTGFVYMQARYYDPATGRFLSVDPVTPTAGALFGFNRYDYANNNPINHTDPDGRSTCANASCTLSRIDSVVPRANSQPPPVNGSQGISSSSAVGRNVSAGYAVNITFQNDNPHGASPDQPISTATANTVESTITASGVQSVNINSSTGGAHAVHSLHAQGRAVDIDRVDGQRVGRGNAGAADLQRAAHQNGDVRENFGPTMMERRNVTDGSTTHVANQALTNEHRTHIHVGGED
ncbi:hypothetical protein PY254_02540 [Rhodanobacter sp. AS-Z3]|uniref:RHS repeat-associated core domain-containing protein n=1 Tax=Rhodanobacter sp. AS-Z3 TaxID=3031330 RepID=UPI002478F44C|nr:RHS repeat-associated core domain-containing protein [Rhodanobacter sp. AS-Z3]WEN15573.1 hypothetical protein PY254_02540 [Rhodanobacter sp. AS-Z3]